MDSLLEHLGFQPVDRAIALRAGCRLLMALLLGAVVGWERARSGRAAGLRTHMLVGLGSALFTIVAVEAGGGAVEIAQLVKGIAAGIGFLGAGAILKNQDEREIRGLTTAATVWLTAAVGMAVGVGFAFIAVIAILFSVVTLALGFLENKREAGGRLDG